MERQIVAVRVRMVPVPADLAEDENKLDHQVTVDLIIDRLTRESVGRHMVFGIYGSPVRDDVTPFLLHPNGKVDFGNNAEPGERFEKCNVRSRPIEVGELATWENDFTDWSLRIIAVQETPELFRS